MAAFPGENGKIAFSSFRDGDQEIYIMNSDGSAQTRLTNVLRTDFDPEWSPDGSRIAFTSRRDGPYDIYVMNPDGSGQTNFTAGLGGDQFNAGWSPDGTKIAFTHSTPGAGQRQLWTMNPDGSGAAMLDPVHGGGRRLVAGWQHDRGLPADDRPSRRAQPPRFR